MVWYDAGVETDMDTESEIPPRKLKFSNDEMKHSFSNHFKDLGTYVFNETIHFSID